MSPEAHSAPRSLAEALRVRDDASLAALLRSRPDLITPVPTDLTQLATRAGTRASVLRALERLDRFALQTAEALAVAPDPASYDTLLGLMAGDAGDETIAGALPQALGILREQALVWGDDDRLRLVRTARELLAPSAQHPSPTGLGPTVQEATSGMSPGRIQEIVTTAGLPSTHDSVSAVTALTSLFTHRKKMAKLLAGAPEAAQEVLSRLVWGPPYGQVTAEPAAHLRWLLDRGLLLPTAPGTVVLPREVALHLRGGRAHRAPEPLPPAVAPAAAHSPQVVDATAAGQAYTALATVEELLKDWDEGGPAVLRAGGLSVRDLKRTAVALDVSEPVAAFWVELAYAAGLIASDGEADERYSATPAYDEWLEQPPAERWARLAQAWLAATRTPGLVGGRDAKDRALSALGPGLDRSAAPEVRHRVLSLLAWLPRGAAPDTESVLARLRWERPLRGARQDGDDDLRSRLARWTLSEAELLGVTGRGALAAHGRVLLGAPPATGSGSAKPGTTGTGAPAAPGATSTGAPTRGATSTGAPAAPDAGSPVPSGPGDKLPVHHHRAPDRLAPLSAPEQAVAAAAATRLLAPLLPEPLDHVLLQADLTAVAPGPLRRPLADMLGVLADVESKGGATVYRFTPASVRRALDAGQTAADLHAFLAEHSRTPVPQPLAYLVDDVARRHGHLRVGAASAYVRCDDDALLNEILADKRAAALHLRRLAPTVLAAPADPATLLEGLRAMGYAPAAESAEGDVLITRAHAHRTPPRTAPEPVPDGPPPPDATLLAAAIRAIRAGDLAATAPRKQAGEPLAGGELPRTSSAETLATMQAAVLTGDAVWIGYVNAEGAASQRVIAPIRVEGGFVTAYDHTADEVRTYPLHRITGVAELADD
ncbi:helicase-associated domain-containing protein [Streptomyces sp. 5-8]|uniref:Helicase-associated domain-containing protein n=1 Tax=Streptomyces musisoli TaxID=2802280 RepID=A0ABS1PCT5_9ACTN|nr:MULTISPECIES: helicase C-terminal domain-containing protein [Streptomyces]MBL1110191.1 helicase-associated domain-containing protein [Streptomyces musisoli]MBY8843300.1 helicase-associated domain-containing protein [Streptomyces sp. SP2-10]